MANIRTVKLDGFSQTSLEQLMENNVLEVFRLIDGLKEKKFLLADIDIDHRAILHWEKEGLVEKQSDSGKWRRFSFLDYIWLRLIKEMRDFGLSISIIKMIQSSLFEPADKEILNQLSEADLNRTKSKMAEEDPEIGQAAFEVTKEDLLAEADNESHFNWAEAITLAVIVSGAPSYLLVSLDGDVQVVSMQPKIIELQLKNLASFLNQKNWLVISITNIVADFYDKKDVKDAVYYNMIPLSDKEKEIVEIIRSGGVSNINIALKNGKEFYVEILRKKPARKVLEEIEGIIAKRKYSRITLDTENGKVSYLNEIEKRIIK